MYPSLLLKPHTVKQINAKASVSDAKAESVQIWFGFTYLSTYYTVVVYTRNQKEDKKRDGEGTFYGCLKKVSL